MNKKNKAGYITVYLSLITGILISFLFTIIEGARMNAIQFQTECVMDIGLNSIFAEYNREMLKQYDLLFIDASYGSSHPTVERTKSHLLQYMNLNFNPPGKDMLPSYKDITSVHADNATLREVSYASDGNGNVMEYQIFKYMKDTTGLSLFDGAEQTYEEYKRQEEEYERLRSERSQNKEAINGMIDELNANREEDEDPVGISNPADAVEDLSSNSALRYAVRDINSLSGKKENLSKYFSRRDCNKGYGLREYQKIENSLIEKQIYSRYLFNKCGYYDHKKDNAALNYQVEYLLKGQASDLSNIEMIAEKIFKIRYAVNMTYLFSDTGKQAEAEELALVVTSGIMLPQLCEAVKLSILFAWGYAESAKDLRILFDGNKLADIKTSSSWNTPLSQLVTFKDHLNEYTVSENGRNYKDYLHAFVMMENKKNITKRLMDIMEMDIRRTVGNQSFQIDYCIYQLQAEVNVSSTYGYGYQITRTYSYE